MLLAHQVPWLSIPCPNNMIILPLFQSLNTNKYQATKCLNQLMVSLVRLSEVL
jgi:hypothetical protein